MITSAFRIIAEKLFRLWLHARLFLYGFITRKTYDALDPEAAGREMYGLSKKFGEKGDYFNCLRFEAKFLFPFVSKAFEHIIRNIPKDAKVLDICGGCGNLGLALSFRGYDDYLLADIDTVRMKWGSLLWKKFGRALRWKKENALRMSFSAEVFDVVVLLGWENKDLPYSYALRECARVLKKGGHLIFTYHNMEEIIEGCWDWDPKRTYSYLPYSIGREALLALCRQAGISIDKEERAGHPKTRESFFPDGKERFFPQYILWGRKA